MSQMGSRPCENSAHMIAQGVCCDALQLRSSRYRLKGVGNAGNGDGALDVAVEHCQAGFCGNALEPPRSELGAPI